MEVTMSRARGIDSVKASNLLVTGSISMSICERTQANVSTARPELRKKTSRLEAVDTLSYFFMILETANLHRLPSQLPELFPSAAVLQKHNLDALPWVEVTVEETALPARSTCSSTSSKATSGFSTFILKAIKISICVLNSSASTINSPTFFL
uniref:Uncharacterized protein n=1 Tax=Cucumis melo TaxID=3656 RepID=A0A9I9EH09_CUCME